MATLLKRGRLIAAAAGAGFVITAAALAGCGRVAAGGTAQGTSGSPTAAAAPMKLAPVCARPAEVRSVRVTRLPTLSQLGQTKPVSRKLPGVTVRDPAKARALARLICAQPRMPHGTLSCPVAIGGGYQLVFMAARLHLPPVTIRASGCETVTGAGGLRARWLARSPTFWTKLSQLTGIAAPAHTP